MTKRCPDYQPNGLPMKEEDECQNCTHHIPENDWTGKPCCTEDPRLKRKNKVLG